MRFDANISMKRKIWHNQTLGYKTISIGLFVMVYSRSHANRQLKITKALPNKSGYHSEPRNPRPPFPLHATNSYCARDGLGRSFTLGISATVALGALDASGSSEMTSGGCGLSSAPLCLLDSPLLLKFALDANMESASDTIDEAEDARFEPPASSAAKRSFSSFSRRVSRPRLWQYQNTKSSTAFCEHAFP